MRTGLPFASGVPYSAIAASSPRAVTIGNGWTPTGVADCFLVFRSAVHMSERNIVCLAIVVAVAVLFYCLTPLAADQDSLYRGFSPLVEVNALVRRRFVRSINDDRLVNGAIRGLMLNLDPYSGYISPAQMEAFERRHTGERVGIGVELGMRNGDVVVIAPYEQGPAIESGVRPGDVVLAVDDNATQDLSVVDVEALLSGEAGTPVGVKMRRDDGAIYYGSMVRRRIKRSTVRGIQRRPDGTWDYWADRERRVGYIRISHFEKGTAVNFETALHRITQHGATSLIIDLRFNPGGVFPEAVAMVDMFIDSGTIVTTVNRRQAVDTYHASPEDTDTKTKLAVLINGGSASSSEIFAGALQDHGRAIVVGERSFGKGSVQDFIRLAGGDSGIKITVARYRLPSGRIIHRTRENHDSEQWGVIPDVPVAISRKVVDAIRDRWANMGESLPNGTEPNGSEALIMGDPQLGAALNELCAAIGS